MSSSAYQTQFWNHILQVCIKVLINSEVFTSCKIYELISTACKHIHTTFFPGREGERRLWMEAAAAKWSRLAAGWQPYSAALLIIKLRKRRHYLLSLLNALEVPLKPDTDILVKSAGTGASVLTATAYCWRLAKESSLERIMSESAGLMADCLVLQGNTHLNTLRDTKGRQQRMTLSSTL